MNSTTPISLKWQRPIEVGKMPKRDEQDKFAEPHIYITSQRYSNGSVIYVGQSKNFLNRLWDHYRNFLGLHYFVRDDDGECHYDPGKHYMLERLNEFDKLMPVVLADVRRLRIFYATCDSDKLDPAESTLINAVMDYCEKHEGYKCDNGRRQQYGYDKPITITMDFDHKMSAKDREVLIDLFGGKVLTGTLEAEG